MPVSLVGMGEGTAPLAVGNLTPPSNSTLNNTTARINSAVHSFALWFATGLGIVIGLSVAILLVGGILNYALVGRKRGEWTPAHAVGPRSPGPGQGPPGPGGPPPGGGGRP